MLIPVGFAQVNLRFAGAAVPQGAEITFGVEHGGLTPLEVGQAVENAWVSAAMSSSLIATCVLVDALVKFGPNDTGPSAVNPINHAGLWAASEAGAVATSVLVRKNTATGGRRGRGRWYLPVPPESVVGPGGVLVPAYVSDTQTRCNAFLANLGVASLPMVLLHSEPGIGPSDVTSLVVDTVVASQRRRQR